MRTRVSIVILAFCLGTAGRAAAAPILQVNGSGILIGVTGLDVGGVLYDVEFVDNSCTVIFDGCDAAGDFDFTTQPTAVAAANVLLAQVFGSGDSFDTTPGLTFGCPTTASCNMWIPYQATPTGFVAAVAVNSGGVVVDGVGSASTLKTSNFATIPGFVFADFSPASRSPCRSPARCCCSAQGWRRRTPCAAEPLAFELPDRLGVSVWPPSIC